MNREAAKMKYSTTLACLLLLTGCGTYVPLEELRAQALQSGDWTAVERREAVLAKRDIRRGTACPKGTMLMCESRVGNRKCHCVDRNSMSRMMTGW